MKCILLPQRGVCVCDFLCLIINVYIYFVFLEETKPEVGSVLSSSPSLCFSRTLAHSQLNLLGQGSSPVPADHLNVG